MMDARHSRRSFIAVSTLSVSSPWWLMSEAAARADDSIVQPELPIYKSLKWGMIVAEGSVEHRFRLAAEAGFAGLELDSPGSVTPDETRQAALATGMSMEGVVDSTHWQVRLTDPDEQTHHNAVRDLQTAIRDCHAAGGHSVLLVPGHGRDGTVEETTARAAAGVRAAIPLAARLGIHILIENVWNEMFYQHDGPDNQTADALMQFVDAFDSPWVGVHFDVGNHQKYSRPAAWIRALGKRIVKLDIKDWSVKDGFCKIGDGDVDWADVRAALREIGFCGWAAAEVAGGGRDELQHVSRRMDEVLGLAAND